MALTRSSFKCCIGHISLDTDDAAFVGPKVIHKGLLNSWTLMSAEASAPDIISAAFNDNYKSLCLEFIKRQKASCLTELFTSNQKTFKSLLAYMKCLVTWHLKLDAFQCLRDCNDTCDLIKAVMDAQSDALPDSALVSTAQNSEQEAQSNVLYFFHAACISIFNEPTYTAIVASIDEIGVPASTDASIWRYVILDNGVVTNASIS